MINSIKKISQRYRRAIMRCFEEYCLSNKLRGEDFNCPIRGCSFGPLLLWAEKRPLPKEMDMKVVTNRANEARR